MENLDRPDMQLAKTVLRVLQNFNDSDLQHFSDPSLELGDSEHADDCALLHYDLQKTPNILMPTRLSRISDSVIQHINSAKPDDPWGLLEDDVIILRLSDNGEGSSGRVLLFHFSYIAKVLEKLFPQERITPAEQKTLLQSLSGLTLREAADLDSVSYETKKTHMQSVFQKTQIKKQQLLSVFLITHLTLEVAAKQSRQTSNTETDEMFFHYVDNYMGAYVRASVIQESPNRRFRIIELGDPAGTPVVCAHHLGLISFSEEEIEYIHRHKLRLICPLRHGALGPKDPKISLQEHFDHATAGIKLAVSLAGGGKTPILGLLSGCLYIFNYLESHPDTTELLILLAASYKRPEKIDSHCAFKKNLHQLATDHQRTLELTVSRLLESVDDPVSLKTVMKESHNESAADFETIDTLFQDEQQVKAMQLRLKNSAISIVQDLKNQATGNWPTLSDDQHDIPIHFLHGDRDTLIPYSDIEDLTRSAPHLQLHTIKGAGNWMFGKYTKETAATIRRILDAKTKN